MNILVIGCRKVGSCLANYLSSLGHDVAIVDRDAESFDLLDDNFSGYTIQGIPIDQDVLRRAGIAGCDALAAVSPDDNVNVMVSQVAREIFHVPRVIARIYDPQRKDVFSHFGLKTICPTNQTVDAIYSMLMDMDETEVTFDSSVVGFHTLAVPAQYTGEPPRKVPMQVDEALFAVLHRDGTMHLMGLEKGLRLAPGDRLVVSKIVD